jgi:transcriptional regulator with XRE-family HTH domain
METAKIISSREIGEAIKRRRKELGISQERLAEILDVSYQQVQRYENGSNRLNVENIQVIAETLSVPVTYFFTRWGKPVLADPPLPYGAEEEIILLGHFRKIPAERDRRLVVEVAHLVSGR